MPQFSAFNRHYIKYLKYYSLGFEKINEFKLKMRIVAQWQEFDSENFCSKGNNTKKFTTGIMCVDFSLLS